MLSGSLRSRSPSLLSWLIVNFSAIALPSERDDYRTRAGALQSRLGLENPLHSRTRGREGLDIEGIAENIRQTCVICLIAVGCSLQCAGYIGGMTAQENGYLYPSVSLFQHSRFNKAPSYFC